MQKVDDYNLALTDTNVNTLMQRVLDRIKANSVINEPLPWNLATALNYEMQNLAQTIDYDELEEIKQYEYSCEIELYPMLQYVEANSAKEAIELVEQQMKNDKFLNELDSRDFHCTSANIVKETKEYKQWRESHKEQS
jgi:hypothetical protein